MHQSNCQAYIFSGTDYHTKRFSSSKKYTHYIIFFLLFSIGVVRTYKQMMNCVVVILAQTINDESLADYLLNRYTFMKFYETYESTFVIHVN